MDSIATINSYFETCFNNASTIKNAKTVADIDKSVSDVITKLIPQELNPNRSLGFPSVVWQ